MNELLSGKKKIIAMLVGVISGLSIALGCDAEVITQVSGAVVALASVVTYIIAEGTIDVTRLTDAANKVNTSINLINEDEIKDEQL